MAKEIELCECGADMYVGETMCDSCKRDEQDRADAQGGPLSPIVSDGVVHGWE